MDFLDYVFQGLTIVVALVTTVFTLQQVERVRARREYKRRFKAAQEFQRQLREQLGGEVPFPDVDVDEGAERAAYPAAVKTDA